MPIRAVIFDFNGVLIDDEHVHFDLFRQVLAGQGITLDEATYHDRYLGYDDRGCFTAALIDNGREAPPDLVATLIANKAARYISAAESGLKFFPHAAEAIARLAQDRPVAICSGALRAEIEYALSRLNVRSRVVSITSAEDTTACKPDPQGYLLALDRLREAEPGLHASECIVIEDSLAGVQAAKAVGMFAVGITHTYTAAELKSAGADALINGLDQLTNDWIAAAALSEPA